MSSTEFHEAVENLSEETQNTHRAIVSLMEELEAVDWYQQRADACGDENLRAILEHNKNEEVEHACMVIEWLRRNHAKFDEELRTYLFTDGPIAGIEERETSGAANGAKGDGSLGIGGARGDR
jgi:ferritin-like protein